VSVTTAVTKTTSTKTTPTTVSAPTTTGPFRCPAAGVFADPKDCHSYYRYDIASNPQRGNCLFYQIGPQYSRMFQYPLLHFKTKNTDRFI
jgi:hypothetical protein